MKKKTNNLEEDFDKKFVNSFAGVSCVCKVNKDNIEFYKPEEIKKFILKREKAQKKEIIEGIKNNKICLNCGRDKEPDLSNWCRKCWEEE